VPPPETRVADAFLLSREWRDADSGVEVVLWARAPESPVRARFTGQEAVMFVPRGADTKAPRRVARPLTTLRGDPVDAVYFRSQRALIDERERIRARLGVALESDVKPADRFLMERFVTGAIQLRGEARLQGGVLQFHNPSIKAADVRLTLSVLSLDIETDGFDGPLLSAAIVTPDVELVLVRGEGTDRGAIRFARDEKALLNALFAEIRALDPDVLVGWNVIEFDLAVLEARSREHRVPFAIGRAGESARVLPGSSPQQLSIARVPGRVVLDGIAVLKSATYRFDRFTLDHVARALLGRGKRIGEGVSAVAEIRRMHAEDVDALAAYNLEDCRLVLGIFERADLVEFAMERARLTGLAMDRPGGSVAAFDHLYLPRLHRRGVVAPDVGAEVELVASPGGYVLDSVPGLYQNVLSFDFRSLYPSIIRTFRIDPLGLHQPGKNPVPGESGATFAREGAILPALIETLHDARSRAMAAKNDALSRAIKILMNSFYGVLGTPGCRFFDPRLPTSITRRGHAVIERARAFFVARGLAVLYGDTDSLFVHLEGAPGPTESEARERGKALAAELTRTIADEIRRDLDLESHLELRFESHYLRFLMPTTRGTERGSKKRYAGLVRGPDGELSLVVRGLEAVRTDWTALARRVQRELLRRVFTGEPFEAWLERTARDLASGLLDDELVYRKRLRQRLADYADEGAPPHVRAARMREAGQAGGEESSEVEYVMTTRGPEPAGERQSPIDYGHYLAKQLAPVCDVVLPFLGTSFEAIAGTQRSLF
jgi:DNA polymerase-2